MKKTWFIIVLILPILLFSCKVEDNGKKNGKGASATAYWMDAVEDWLMLFPDMAFKFNAWLTAPTNEKRDSIKQLYFPNYTIRKKSWTVNAESVTVYTMSLEGRDIFAINILDCTDLSNPNADWFVGYYDAFSSNPFHRTYTMEGGCTCEIYRQSNNSNIWEIRAHPSFDNFNGLFPWTSELTLTLPDNSVPSTLVGCDCSLSGYGNFYFYAMKNQDKDIYYCQSYTIENGHIQNFKGINKRNLWTSGELSMSIISNMEEIPDNGNYVKEESLKSSFFAKKGKQHAIITMHGVEEDWELPEPQSLDGHLRESSLLDWLLPWF